MRLGKSIVGGLVICALAGCSLPRGAALQSEVLAEAEAENPTFAVVPVTRAAVPQIAKWPITGWHGHYHWIGQGHGGQANVIRPGDRLDLTIWDSQENSLLTNVAEKRVTMTGLEVSSAGTIFVPYIDEVRVADKTPSAARRLIERRMEEVVPAAQVQLELQDGQGNSVDLVNGVAKPGTYPIQGSKFSILSLIAQGGGLNQALRNPLVRLLRGSRTYEIRAEKLFSASQNNTSLRGGDKVLVEEDERHFTALGATGTEDLIYFPEDTVNALEALSLMGGISDGRADPKGVLVLREYKTSHVKSGGAGPSHPQTIFSIDLTTADGLFAARNFLINPDDTVLATESPVTKAQTILGLFGAVLGAGGQFNNLTR